MMDLLCPRLSFQCWYISFFAIVEISLLPTRSLIQIKECYFFHYTCLMQRIGARLYQGMLMRPLPSYAMLAGRDFNYPRTAGSSGALWCQSANSSDGIGRWLSPDGAEIPSDPTDPFPFHTESHTGQVGLRLESGANVSQPGLYVCTIPDEKGNVQKLVAWVAKDEVYDGTNNNCKYAWSRNFHDGWSGTVPNCICILNFLLAEIQTLNVSNGEVACPYFDFKKGQGYVVYTWQ